MPIVHRTAAFTDILQFRARVLATQGKRNSWTLTLPRNTVPPTYVNDRDAPILPAGAARHTPPNSYDSRTALRGQAAASAAGHSAQTVDRLSSTRAVRATVAPARKSAGTASPVPRYISSGVWPRNAECGNTWLCSST